VQQLKIAQVALSTHYRPIITILTYIYDFKMYVRISSDDIRTYVSSDLSTVT